MARELIGKVVSLSADKSIVVEVQESRRHKLYDKQYYVSKRFKVHDEKNQASLEDVVKISETTPKSRHKRWELTKVLQSSSGGKQ